MKVVLAMCLCAAAVTVTQARPRAEPPSSEYGVPGGYPRGGPSGGGHSGGHGGDDGGADANYSFMYEVQDAPSSLDFGHMETRMGHVATGTYHVLLPDGRMQKVDYIADQDGYKPTVTYQGEAKYGPGVGGGKVGGGGNTYLPPSTGGGYRYR